MYMHQNKKQHLKKLYIQKKGYTMGVLFKDMVNSSCGFEQNTMRASQLDYIHQLNGLLCINDPVACGEIITRENVEKCTEFFSKKER